MVLDSWKEWLESIRRKVYWSKVGQIIHVKSEPWKIFLSFLTYKIFPKNFLLSVHPEATTVSIWVFFCGGRCMVIHPMHIPFCRGHRVWEGRAPRGAWLQGWEGSPPLQSDCFRGRSNLSLNQGVLATRLVQAGPHRSVALESKTLLLLAVLSLWGQPAWRPCVHTNGDRNKNAAEKWSAAWIELCQSLSQTRTWQMLNQWNPFFISWIMFSSFGNILTDAMAF